MKPIVLVCLTLLMAGCSSSSLPEKVIAKVGPATITQSEFEEAYKASVYSQQTDPNSRREFLNVLINRKLILLDAEQKGLDKRKDFLSMIQNFWEQSLLTMALNEKSKELSVNAGEASKEEVEEVYNAMVKDGRTAKPLTDIYPQIQAIVGKKNETERFNQWVNSLHKNTKIDVYQDNL